MNQKLIEKEEVVQVKKMTATPSQNSKEQWVLALLGLQSLEKGVKKLLQKESWAWLLPAFISRTGSTNTNNQRNADRFPVILVLVQVVAEIVLHLPAWLLPLPISPVHGKVDTRPSGLLMLLGYMALNRAAWVRG